MPSLEAALRRIHALGGDVLVRKTRVKGKGYFAVGLDTEGNPIGLWAVDPSA